MKCQRALEKRVQLKLNSVVNYHTIIVLLCSCTNQRNSLNDKMNVVIRNLKWFQIIIIDSLDCIHAYMHACILEAN